MPIKPNFMERLILFRLNQGPGSVAAVFAGLQGLNQFHNFNGQTYTPDEIADWLTAVGFTNHHHINLRKAPGVGLMVGTKTG